MAPTLTAETPALEPYVIQVTDEALGDLKRRLQATRWSTDANNEDSYYGISSSYLRDLVAYWINEFDWRRAERQINAFTHHRVEISGTPVHFIREPGTGPSPIPIILSHGWPWTFWDWSKVIRPLADPAAFGGDPADAFDVIVPSLAGFGFSAPTSGDMNFWKMAELWHTLMTETLGYERYAAGGCDYGALVTGQLGHKYADQLYGIHLGQDLPLNMFQSERPWDLSEGHMIPEDATPQLREGILELQKQREPMRPRPRLHEQLIFPGSDHLGHPSSISAGRRVCDSHATPPCEIHAPANSPRPSVSERRWGTADEGACLDRSQPDLGHGTA